MRTNIKKLLRVVKGPGEGAPIVQEFSSYVFSTALPTWVPDGYNFFGFPLFFDPTSRQFTLDKGDGTSARYWVGVIASDLTADGGTVKEPSFLLELITHDSIIYVTGAFGDTAFSAGSVHGIELDVSDPDDPYCTLNPGIPNASPRLNEGIVSLVNQAFQDPKKAWVRPIGRFFYLGGAV